VTPRVCGMSFPASGFENCYRNNINDVAAFLEERHRDSYLIFNLSYRHYDYRKFKNMVKEYEWQDHHSPAMIVIFEVCQEMYSFLSKN
jgi:phosphatidylinositol-3,4,5-trisphosphate 3-phosphatase/dual-specificity protein phosphatase PTEN